MCDILETPWPLPCNTELEAKLTQNALAHLDRAMPLMPDVPEVADDTVECCEPPVKLIKEFEDERNG